MFLFFAFCFFVDDIRVATVQLNNITNPAKGGYWNHYIKVTTGGRNSDLFSGKNPSTAQDSSSTISVPGFFRKSHQHAKNKIKPKDELTVCLRNDKKPNDKKKPEEKKDENEIRT